MTDQSFMQKYEPWGIVGYINMRHNNIPPYVPLPPEEMERQKREYMERLAASNGVHWS